MIQLFKPLVSQEAIDAATVVLNSGWIGLGPKTLEFERQFAKYIGCTYAVAVNSATSALHLACVVSDIKKDDEVITTPITFVSTNHVILYQGATPVFCDVDESTLLLDLDKAEELVTKRTKAVIVVHYGGNPVAIDRLHSFAGRHHLKVIEDAAHACGATYNGRKIGSFGLTCFSFHAVKNLPLGDGGMVTTDDENIYNQLMRLRWMGIDKSTFARNRETYQWEYDVSEAGFKYHMNDINAAMGIEHLKRLDEWNKRRQDMVDLYRRLLSGVSSDKLSFLNITPGARSANHLCVIKVKNRDLVVDRLKEYGISVGVHYKPNHLYKPYAAYVKDTRFPVAEKAYAEIISLPLHLYLTDDDIKSVAEAVEKIVLDDK